MAAELHGRVSMMDDWFDGDKQAYIAHHIGFNIAESATLWQRIAEGKRRD